MSKLRIIIRDNVRALMTERGLSPTEMGRKTGFSRQSIYRMLGLHNEIGSDFLEKLAEALDVSADRLVVPAKTPTPRKRRASRC
jgi:transcriptional regulator with XRE-family HTH domain